MVAVPKFSRASRRVLIGLAGLAVVVSACSNDDAVVTAGQDATSTTTPTATSTSTVSTTPTSEPATTVTDATSTSPVTASQVIAADSSWELLDEDWFVYGVVADDVLNVRSAPGVDADTIFTLASDADQVRRFGEVVFVGDDRWTPVDLGSDPGQSIGWVNLAFLRPMPAVPSPVVEGSPVVDPAVLDAVIAALSDPVELSAFVGPDGLVIATEPAISGNEQNLTVTDLMSGDATVRVWGSEPGSGEPIRSSTADRLAQMRGSTAFTSTEVVGHGVQIGSGNIPNTIDQAFPGSVWVEYHFGGTAWFADLDWESVTLVFDDAGSPSEPPILLAVVSAAWAP